jgi:hypothetical protein
VASPLTAAFDFCKGEGAFQEKHLPPLSFLHGKRTSSFPKTFWFKEGVACRYD